MSARQLLLKGQGLLFVLGVGQVESCRGHMRVSSSLCSTVQPAILRLGPTQQRKQGSRDLAVFCYGQHTCVND